MMTWSKRYYCNEVSCNCQENNQDNCLVWASSDLQRAEKGDNNVEDMRVVESELELGDVGVDVDVEKRLAIHKVEDVFRVGSPAFVFCIYIFYFGTRFLPV